MLFREPVKKLSRQITSCPSRISRSHKWLPRNPAPPVTRTRFDANRANLLAHVKPKGIVTSAVTENWRLKTVRCKEHQRSPDPRVRGSDLPPSTTIRTLTRKP